MQQRLGAPRSTRLTDVYRGQQRFPITFPQLDPYCACRREACAGHFDVLDPPRPATGARFYAYLPGERTTPRRVLMALAASGLSGRVHVRDAAVADWPLASTGRIEILPQAPWLARAPHDAELVSHHGGLATTQVALAAGRPQVLVPQVFDQALVAEALADAPFVAGLPGAVAGRSIVAAAESLLVCPEAGTAAMRHARSIHECGLHRGQQRILGELGVA